MRALLTAIVLSMTLTLGVASCTVDGVFMPPTPIEVQLITQVMVSQYVKDRNISPESVAAIIAGLETVKAMTVDGTLDPAMFAMRIQNELPPDYQDLGALLVLIATNRLDIPALIKAGRNDDVAMYYGAVIDGVVTVLSRPR